MELNKVLDRVRKLLTLAEHESTPTAEASAAREQADALMLKYAIEEATLDATRPVSERAKPGVVVMPVGEFSNLTGYLATMAGDIAKHCRCRIRFYDHWADGQYQSKVYGFESDLHYFEVLYTILRLHMLGVLLPKIDPKLSDEDNAYFLHNAGFNWLEIAEMYGWVKVSEWQHPDVNRPYKHKETGEVQPATQVGSRIKRAYYRAVEARNEQPTKIAAGGSKGYREDAASGYISRMHQRLRKASQGREQTGELVLASRMQDLEDFWRESNENRYTRCPRCEKLSANPYECEHCGQFIKDRPEACPRCAANPSKHCRDHPAGSRGRARLLNTQAYQRGVAHADTADLTANRVRPERQNEIG